MSTLLQDQGQWRRPQIVGSEREPVPPRYWNVLALHMAGRGVREIQELTGYADSTIYGILKDERVIAVRQQLLKGLEDELEAMLGQAVGAIREAFTGVELPGDQKWATEQVFKLLGKYKDKAQGSTTINISAEDVALQILNQAKEAQGGG